MATVSTSNERSFVSPVLVPGQSYYYTIQATFVDDSGATETSNQVTVTWAGSVDTTAPSCALTGVIAGPPKQIEITVQDTGSGLGSVVVTNSTMTPIA